MTLIKSIVVTENGREQTVETDAPFDAVLTAFYATNSTDELVEQLTGNGYTASESTVTLRLNYDEK